METILWILAFPALLLGLWFTITGMGKRALSRQLSKPAEGDEWAEYKRLATQVRERKAKEVEEWTKDFNELLQSLCKKHEYDGNAWGSWYKCKHCNYEQPWRYSGDCSCQTHMQHSITDPYPEHVLLRRSGNCVRHGRDDAKKAVAEAYYRVYTKGGYVGRRGR